MLRQTVTQIKLTDDRIVTRLMALMFFSSIGRGLATPYVNLYLSELGVTATAIGTILSVAALFELTVSPVLNNLADKYNRHRLLLILQYIFFTIGTIMMVASSSVVFLGAMIVLIELGKRSPIILSMQLSLTRLEQIHRDILGRVRSFNAFGFSLANFCQGLIFTFWSYGGMFVFGGLFTALSVGFINVLPKQIAHRKSDEPTAPRRRPFYFLILIQLIVMLGLNSGFAFWLIHFRDNIGIHVEDLGIILGISALVEAPFFALFDPIVRRYDVRLAYILGASGMGVTWLLMGVATSIIVLIPILIFRAFVFTMLNLSTLVLIARISDPRNVATNQSLLQVTVPGLAILFSAPLMGWIYDHYSPVIFFGVCMLMMLVGSGIMLVVYRFMVPKEA